MDQASVSLSAIGGLAFACESFGAVEGAMGAGVTEGQRVRDEVSMVDGMGVTDAEKERETKNAGDKELYLRGGRVIHVAWRRADEKEEAALWLDMQVLLRDVAGAADGKLELKLQQLAAASALSSAYISCSYII
ncbi:hypothetical protein L7F22_044791 [Adiantum nelumboides]|nr:hypothetical protein [Adiantum nelumboides]